MTVQETYEAVRSRVKVGMMTPTQAINEVAELYKLPASTVNWRYYDRLKKKREMAAHARAVKAAKEKQEAYEQEREVLMEYALPMWREAQASVALDGETQALEGEVIAEVLPDADTQIKYAFGGSGTSTSGREVHRIFMDEPTLAAKLQNKIYELQAMLDVVRRAEQEMGA